jgi:hypothetical protein
MKLYSKILAASLLLTSASCSRQFSDKTSAVPPAVIIQPDIPVKPPVHHATIFSAFQSADGQTFKLSPSEFNSPVAWEGKVSLSYWVADTALWDCTATVVVSGTNSLGELEFSHIYCAKDSATIAWSDSYKAEYSISEDNILSFVTPKPFFFESKEYSEVK